MKAKKIFRNAIPNTWPRAAAEYCARKLGWHRIECTTTVDGQKTIRTPEDIQSEVMAYLERILS